MGASKNLFSLSSAMSIIEKKLEHLDVLNQKFSLVDFIYSQYIKDIPIEDKDLSILTIEAGNFGDISLMFLYAKTIKQARPLYHVQTVVSLVTKTIQQCEAIFAPQMQAFETRVFARDYFQSNAMMESLAPKATLGVSVPLGGAPFYKQLKREFREFGTRQHDEVSKGNQIPTGLHAGEVGIILPQPPQARAINDLSAPWLKAIIPAEKTPKIYQLYVRDWLSYIIAIETILSIEKNNHDNIVIVTPQNLSLDQLTARMEPIRHEYTIVAEQIAKHQLLDLNRLKAAGIATLTMSSEAASTTKNVLQGLAAHLAQIDKEVETLAALEPILIRAKNFLISLKSLTDFSIIQQQLEAFQATLSDPTKPVATLSDATEKIIQAALKNLLTYLANANPSLEIFSAKLNAGINNLTSKLADNAKLIDEKIRDRTELAAIEQFDHPTTKHLTIVHGNIAKPDMEILQQHAQPFFGCTGDMSFSECLALKKIPFYDVPGHKVEFFKDLLTLTANHQLTTLQQFFSLINALFTAQQKIYEPLKPKKTSYWSGGVHGVNYSLESDESVSRKALLRDDFLPVLRQFADQFAALYANPKLAIESQQLTDIIRTHYSADARVIAASDRAVIMQNYPAMLALEKSLLDDINQKLSAMSYTNFEERNAMTKQHLLAAFAQIETALKTLAQPKPHAGPSAFPTN